VFTTPKKAMTNKCIYYRRFGGKILY